MRERWTIKIKAKTNSRSTHKKFEIKFVHPERIWCHMIDEWRMQQIRINSPTRSKGRMKNNLRKSPKIKGFMMQFWQIDANKSAGIYSRNEGDKQDLVEEEGCTWFPKTASIKDSIRSSPFDADQSRKWNPTWVEWTWCQSHRQTDG